MVKSEVSTGSLSNPALVLVEWQTRTAGFRNTDVAVSLSFTLTSRLLDD